MRNPQEVLAEKEGHLAQVRREVEALRFVAPLLVEPEMSAAAGPWPEDPARNRWPLQIEEPPQSA